MGLTVFIFVAYTSFISYTMYKLEEKVLKQTGEKIVLSQKSNYIIMNGYLTKTASIKKIETLVFAETNATILNHLTISVNTLTKEKHQLIRYFGEKISKLNKAIIFVHNEFNQTSTKQEKRLKFVEHKLAVIKSQTNKEIENFYKERDEVAKEIDLKLRSIFGLDDYFNAKAMSLDFGELVIFEVGQYQYNPEAIAIINEAFRKYLKVLIPYQNAIKEIVILGYADNRGLYSKNLKLAQQRALGIKDNLVFTDLVKNNGIAKLIKIKGIVGKNEKLSSRKIKIKFILKNSKVLNMMKRIMND